MTMNAFKLSNFIALQAGWFITCYSSGTGNPITGPGFTLIWLLLHLSLVPDRYIDLRIVLAAGLFGYLADSLLVLSGIIAFPDASRLGMPTTAWMVALWINFALTLRHSMSWLRKRYVVAMAAGAVAGPLAYYAGEKFSAIILADGITPVLAISVEWIIAMLFLLWITEKSETGNGHVQQFIVKALSR